MRFLFPEQDIGHASSSVKTQIARPYSPPRNFIPRALQSIDVNLKVENFTAWLERTAGFPNDVSKWARIKDILGSPRP
jgi:hypothetical protein